VSLAPNSSAFDARDLGVDFRNLRHDQFVAETITEPKPALQLSAQSVQLLDALPPFGRLAHDGPALGCLVDVGRHGSINPAGRGRGRNMAAK
jgi:hypothetical protein